MASKLTDYIRADIHIDLLFYIMPSTNAYTQDCWGDDVYRGIGCRAGSVPLQTPYTKGDWGRRQICILVQESLRKRNHRLDMAGSDCQCFEESQ